MTNIKLSFHGNVKNGKTKFDEPEMLIKHMTSLEGKRITVTISPYRKPRSNKENKYYFGCVIDILGNELGYTPDETHEVLKYKFLLDKTGKYPRVKSTADLSTVEFESYLSQIRIWSATEMNINIPDPENII